MAPVFSEPPPVIEQWFVGIDGVPTGPLGMEELRSKAAAGLVSLDSLVWREGFEDWLPVHKFPELEAAVLDATRGPSPAVAPPATAPSGLSASGPAPGAPAAAAAAPPARLEQADPFAPGAPAMATSGAAPSSSAAKAGPAPDELDRELVLGRRRSGFSPAALLALVVAIGFGVTVGFVVFGGEKTKVIREVVEVPVAQAPPPAENVPAPEPEAEPAASAAPQDSPSAPGKAPAGSKVASGATTKTSGSSQEGLSGLSGLKGLAAGPQAGPGSQGSSSKSQPLSAGQIQTTVSRFTPSVRRSCWQPALDARDPNAPTTARVTVSITVGSDGKVQGANAGGDPRGYPGLASCISRRVRGWTFPPSNGTTTVQVPFVFAAQ